MRTTKLNRELQWQADRAEMARRGAELDLLEARLKVWLTGHGFSRARDRAKAAEELTDLFLEWLYEVEEQRERHGHGGGTM